MQTLNIVFRVVGLTLILLALASCGTNTNEPPMDARVDAQSVEGGTLDGVVSDTAPWDTAAVDAHPSDTAAVDANLSDTGAVDANPSDAAAADSGTPYPGPSPVAHAVAAGRTFSAAIDSKGALWTWGQADHGALGNGQKSQTSPHKGHALVPTQPAAIDKLTMTHVSAGYYHAVALQKNGDVWAWGANASGQLGTGTTTPSSVPVAVKNSGLPSGITFAAVGAGTNHAVALAKDGTV